MRADRLLSILLLLQSRGKITSRELAGKLEVSERTIFRDMEALSASGIPVFAERGREGGWMLSEGYRTSLTGMKPQEIGSLLLAPDSSILKALGIEDDFSSAALKLEAASPSLHNSPLAYLNQRIHIDGAGWHPSGEAYPYLSLLQQAVWEDRKVKISYMRGEDSREYVISPLGLVAKRGVWYAAAENEGIIKTYRVSRLLYAEITGGFFTRPEGFALADYWQQSTAAFKAALPRYPAKLLVRAEAMKELERERYVTIRSSAESHRRGWLSAAADFHTIESACRIILSLSPDVIAVEPEDLVNRILSVFSKTMELYVDISSKNKP
ncbi:YafY family protein [Paenibacillus sp. S150]|uniref:helix-turn-helix transcriptional regulator n=1 Tax=Paenibacillus sp. S150 TaxID=2749826 RepID=UPI001C58B7A9|nr:WYL domain-containing protein [Paenibacillus sp. S150]MBW4082867.1 WYL domain-containing protein [Paenibacillus sp. S150]